MKSFGKLPRNARFCIAVEPLWALFGPMVSYFMPLFQKELGLSEVQMGVVNSANIAAGFLFFALAAPITNKLGRRATSLWFDFIAWSLAMVIWALSRSYIWFLVAAVCNAVVKIVIVSWNLLISEDADEHQRATIFGWVNVIGTFGGFSTFVGGLLIARFGLLPSMRTIFLVGAVAMTLMFVLRYVGTRETEVGVYLKEKYRKESFLKLAATQLPKAKQALRDPFFARMTAIYFIANAVLTIDFFRVLYLREEKGLSPFAISAIPALSAIVSIIVFFFVLPRQKSVKNHSHLANSFLLCTGAQILFMLIPRGSWLAAIVIFPSLQTFYALLQTFRDTVFMNGTDPEHKSERFSLIQAFMLLFSIPIGWISGLLYSLSPHLPFVLSSCLYAAGFVLAIGLNENPKPVKAENSR